MITYKLLEKYKEIAHFCTDREGGANMGNYASFNMSPFSGDDPVHVADNQQILCDRLGIKPEKLIIPYQIHGTEIREIDTGFLQLTKEERSQALNGMHCLHKYPRYALESPRLTVYLYNSMILSGK